MSELMNATWWDSATQDQPADFGLLLVTLNHPSLHEPLRFVCADADVTSRGLTFIGWPAGPRLPSQGARPKRGGLRIANVDEEIGRAVRPLKGRVTLVFEIVERDDPDEVVYDHFGLFLHNVRTEGSFIVADVVGYGSFGQAFPRSSANPEYAPGTFVA